MLSGSSTRAFDGGRDSHDAGYEGRFKVVKEKAI